MFQIKLHNVKICSCWTLAIWNFVDISDPKIELVNQYFVFTPQRISQHKIFLLELKVELRFFAFSRPQSEQLFLAFSRPLHYQQPKEDDGSVQARIRYDCNL